MILRQYSLYTMLKTAIWILYDALASHVPMGCVLWRLALVPEIGFAVRHFCESASVLDFGL